MRARFTISIYREGKFVTRSIGLLPRTARALLESLAAGKEKYPSGMYEARLLSDGRVIKIVKWTAA